MVSYNQNKNEIELTIPVAGIAELYSYQKGLLQFSRKLKSMILILNYWHPSKTEIEVKLLLISFNQRLFLKFKNTPYKSIEGLTTLAFVRFFPPSGLVYEKRTARRPPKKSTGSPGE